MDNDLAQWFAVALVVGSIIVPHVAIPLAILWASLYVIKKTFVYVIALTVLGLFVILAASSLGLLVPLQ